MPATQVVSPWREADSSLWREKSLQAPCETAEVLLDECLARLERAVKEGELPASTDTRAVAMSAWDRLTGGRARRGKRKGARRAQSARGSSMALARTERRKGEALGADAGFYFSRP